MTQNFAALCTIKSVILLLSILCGFSKALTCYEDDGQGNKTPRTNPDWEYCVLIPSASLSLQGGRLFGIGPSNDITKIYDYTFSVNSPAYKILTLCILERYDWNYLIKLRVKSEPEFLFRCLCNYDKCNTEETFHKYFTLEKENV